MDAGAEVVVNRNLGENTNKTFLGVIGILFLLGFVFWIKQITTGFSGYSTQYAWGLYIAAFFMAVAGGAGAMIIAAVANTTKMMDDLISRQYYKAALSMFVMAGFFILADLGAPFNLFKLVFTTNISAPMVMDFWLLVACVIICCLAIFAKSFSRVLSYLGLILAVILLGAESWLVSSAHVQNLWGITMGGGSAFIQVGIMAFALLLLIGQNGKYVRYGLFLSLLLFLAISLTDLFVGMVNGSRLGMQWTAVSQSGLFWTGTVLGIIIPLLMLLMKADKFPSAAIPILAMLGVLLTKWSYIWSSQSIPGIDMIAPVQAAFHPEEIMIVIGFIALGVLVYYGLNARKGGANS